MTAAPPGPNLFSVLAGETNHFSHRRETFAASLIAQAAILAVIIYLTTHAIPGIGIIPNPLPIPLSKNLIFHGDNGGGGGGRELLPASVGELPPASLDAPIVPATVRTPNYIPKLMVDQSVEIAPDIKFPQGGQIGDPNSSFSQWLSNGRAGPGGIGDTGCCDGDGNGTGPHAGNGRRPGPYPGGSGGVGIPVAIYSPEPAFSDEARKQKVQGIVLLILVVGKDGCPYDIHVRRSLGMGLDERAVEAVKNWRFRPATLDGQPVDARIAVEVNFHLY